MVRAKPKGQQKRKVDKILNDLDIKVMTPTAKIPKILYISTSSFSQNKVLSPISAHRNSTPHKPIPILSNKNHHY